MDIKEILYKLKSLNYSLIDQAIVSGSNFLSSILILKLISLKDFGIFATCWMFLLFFSTIYITSIISPMMAILPKRKERYKYFGSLIVFQLVFISIAFFASVIFSFFYFTWTEIDFSYQTVLYFSLTTLFYHFQDFFRKYFFAVKEYRNALLIDSITYLLRFLIIVYFLIYIKNTTLTHVFLIYFITAFLGFIIGLLNFKYTLDLTSIKRDTIDHYKISKWLLPSGILKWTSVNLYLVASSFILGPISIGIIKLGQNITSVYNLFLLGLDNFVPIESGEKYAEKGGGKLVMYLKKIMIYGIVGTLFLGGLISLFSEEIIENIYKKDFIQYNYILYWFSGFFIFMLINSITQIFLVTINKTKVIFKGYVIASIVSLLIFYPLISQFEILGTLFGILISYIILIGIRLININKIINESRYN
ncbi:MAG TPA: hypothetical protein EYG89_01070 [Bacteroidia bacterium]|nr:hypothetical protein [Bacteroidia bacterium]